MDAITIREGRDDDAQAAAQCWVRARQQAVPNVPPPTYTTADALRWFIEELIPDRSWFLAEGPGGRMVGVMVLGDGWMEQLYIEQAWTR